MNRFKWWNYTLVLWIIIILNNIGLAQCINCCEYEQFMQVGKNYFDKELYAEALTEFQAAQIAARVCKCNSNEPAIYIEKVFKGIEKQKEFAEFSKTQAETAENRAKSTLKKLKEKNALIVELLLENARIDILNLDYEEALNNVQLALDINENKDKTVKSLLEIAFWYNEMGNSELAILLITNIANILKLTINPELFEDNNVEQRNQLRLLIRSMDEEYFEYLFNEKYYPEMISVQGGTFLMGCDTSLIQNCQNDELLQWARVNDFKIAKYETTWWQYYLFCKAEKYDYISPGWGTQGDNPVVNVSWCDAINYSNWLSRQKNLKEFYFVKNNSVSSCDSVIVNASSGYHLPTESEWEYAARGGIHAQNQIYSGSNYIKDVAHYIGNSGNRSRTIGVKKPNLLGLYDMSGNVWEWCWDEYSQSASSNSLFQELIKYSYRVLRGGSWSDESNYCRIAERNYYFPTDRHNIYGFRIAQ